MKRAASAAMDSTTKLSGRELMEKLGWPKYVCAPMVRACLRAGARWGRASPASRSTAHSEGAGKPVGAGVSHALPPIRHPAVLHPDDPQPAVRRAAQVPRENLHDLSGGPAARRAGAVLPRASPRLAAPGFALVSPRAHRSARPGRRPAPVPGRASSAATTPTSCSRRLGTWRTAWTPWTSTWAAPRTSLVAAATAPSCWSTPR